MPRRWLSEHPNKLADDNGVHHYFNLAGISNPSHTSDLQAYPGRNGFKPPSTVHWWLMQVELHQYRVSSLACLACLVIADKQTSRPLVNACYQRRVMLHLHNMCNDGFHGYLTPRTELYQHPSRPSTKLLITSSSISEHLHERLEIDI